MTTRSFKDWPADEHDRWNRMGHHFGRTVIDEVKGYARGNIPSDASPEEKLAAE
ncbi:hypothetical protein [Paenibacillus soyae]|uniref:Uncharacterized protein n=1 Tax=Paenibacillus soyae TaxID=2969249 RepID=A0A9X2MS28_9BACL|nr:hypothetical protein [Paenibacillus soyae]MCR2805232.1 hypothetical protein [Paenibacillus soyae]